MTNQKFKEIVEEAQTFDSNYCGADVGDIVQIPYNNKVLNAIIVDDVGGCVFELISLDCVDELPMHCKDDNSEEFLATTLGRWVNHNIYANFPKWVRKVMVPYPYGAGNFAYIRIPTEKQIFGNNFCSKGKFKEHFFKPMNKKRNVIACKVGNDRMFSGYWLEDATDGTTDHYCTVNRDGSLSNYKATEYNGVRIRFMLRKEFFV